MADITLTILRNPFNLSDREIKKITYIPGKTIREYVQPIMMGIDLEEMVFSRNGAIEENGKIASIIVEGEDNIVICPLVGKGGGKNILRTIASIALMTYVGNVAGGLWNSGTSTFWTGLAAGAISAVGGMLINHLFPQPTADMPTMDMATSTPTYSWGSLQSLSGQGNALAVTYGTMRTAGQILSQHITNGDGDKQYLNLLLCGGEGPANSITDIKINDNPISNYHDVSVDIRLGTNDQTAIPNFNDTYADQVLSYELRDEDTWSIHQTEGDGGQGLEITFELPGGLYHVNDNGNLENATVKFNAQYKQVGQSEWKDWVETHIYKVSSSVKENVGTVLSLSAGQNAIAETWTLSCIDGNLFSVIGSVSGRKDDAKVGVAYNNGLIGFTIIKNRLGFFGGFSKAKFTLAVKTNELIVTAAKSSPVRKVYRIDNLPARRYEVRTKCSYKSGTTTRDSTRACWTQLSHISYDDFCRSGKVLVGIKALATDQLSGGMPTVTWLQTVNDINVYNPDTIKYERRSACNPAWVAYDLLHRCKNIHDTKTGIEEKVVFGIPANRIDYQSFADWAAFCAERKLEFEYIFDTPSDLWSSLQKPESVGRGKVILKGTRYSCVCDRPTQPVQLFTMGNMVQDKFQEDFLGIKDRANAVEISFVNKDKGYQRDMLTIYGDDWDNSKVIQNPTQITLYGCTSYQQAYREGKYRLRLNQYLQRTISFDADIDAIACQVGDVILIQHDIPQWGYGGRVLSATKDTIQFDRSITMEVGKAYSVMVRLTDDSLVEKQVIGNVAETDTVAVSTPFSSIPQKWDVFSFGKTHKVTKPFRVLNISRSQEFKRSITALEYVEGVYTEAENVPVINYSDLDDSVPEVENLNLGQQTYRQKDGTIVSEIDCSWVVPKKHIKNSIVWYSRDEGQSWVLWGNTTNNLAVITGVNSQETYLVKVCTLNNSGIVSSGVISKGIYITGKDEPPSNIDSIAAEVNPSDSTKLILKWSAVTDIDLKGYQLSEGDTIVTPTPINDNQYIFTAAKSRQYNFSVVAIDNSGNPSTRPATISINIIIEPAQVAGFTVTPLDSDRSRLRMQWTANSESDISYYEIRLGANWDTASVVATQLKATLFECTLANVGSITYMIKAVNAAGKFSVNPRAITQQYTLTPNAPANGSIIQDPNDRTTLIITWLPITDKDLSQYEIRLGTDWTTAITITTTKETIVRYKVSKSGSYKVMVKSKNVAGYYSTALNLSIQASIEAMDVTGFAALQSISDHSRVTLFWDQPSALDVAYFEIRKGLTWDTGSIIGKRVTGTYFDVIVTEETTQIYWIKAVNVGGIYSQFPSKIEDIYNLNPSTPTNLVIAQNPNDRSELIITWDGIPELDLLEYQVKCGFEWITSDMIAQTKELKTIYKPSKSGDVKVMLKARSNSNFYSDEVSTNFYASLEPSDVTNFRAVQNGESVLFTWDKSPDNDVVSYEIREGSTFANGSIVQTGITMTVFQIPVDTEVTRRFHIKAINRSGRYSQNEDSDNITISNLLPKNVISIYDEIALHNGTHDNTEFGQSMFNYATLSGKFSDYPTTKFSDIGGASVLKLAKPSTLYDAFTFGTGIGGARTKVTGLYGQNGARLTGQGFYESGFTAGKTYTASAYFRVIESRSTTSLCIYREGTGGGRVYVNKDIREWQRISLTWTEQASQTGALCFYSLEGGNYTSTNQPTWEITCIEIIESSTALPVALYKSSGTYTCARKDMKSIITANITTIFQPSVLFSAGTSAALQYRTSRDNIIWTGWANFVPIEATFRYIDFRVLLATNDPAQTPEVNQFTLRVDVPDFRGRKIAAIPAGGTDVSYDHTYYQQVFPLPTSVGLGLKAELISYNLTSAKVRVVNASGTDVGGQVILDYTGF
jgi:predicted phage tail protein